VSAAKTAEPIEMPFGYELGVPKKHALDGGVHWCHLANTIELPLCGGDALVMAVLSSRCGHHTFAV